MCEEWWWNERLVREQAEKLPSRAPASPVPPPKEHQQPEHKPQDQPDPVPA